MIQHQSQSEMGYPPDQPGRVPLEDSLVYPREAQATYDIREGGSEHAWYSYSLVVGA